MSFLKTVSIQHLNASAPAISLAANGNVSIDGTLTVNNNISVVGTIAGNTPTGGTRNRIINGDLSIWQRQTSFTGITGNVRVADKFKTNIGTPGTGVFVVDRSTDVPVGEGFNQSLRMTPSTAITSVGAATYASIIQFIEGQLVSDLNYGTARAKTFTLSFWVKSNVAGIVPASLIQNSVAATTERCFPFTYTINAADTWQKIIVTVPGDTGGGIPNNTDWGLQLNFFYMAIGSNYQSGVANTWNTNSGGNQYIASGQTYLNRANSTSNYFLITGIQLEHGSVATAFEKRIFPLELMLCRRYYEKSYNHTVYPGATGDWSTTPIASMTPKYNNILDYRVRYGVDKRTGGTVTLFNPFSGSSTTGRIERAGVSNEDYSYNTTVANLYTSGFSIRHAMTSYNSGTFIDGASFGTMHYVCEDDY